jgi:hypothetical protein
MKFWLAFLGCFLSANYVMAGGMVSTGGDLTKDSHNPWWLRNTTEVSYCIAVDTKSVSADPSKISLLTVKALEYWQAELNRKLKIVTNAGPINEYFNKIGVGRQNFTKVNCDGTEDLKLQFGYGTLNNEQKEFLGSLDRLVGVSVRTEYDEINLRARGFIYISSDLGPHKYETSADLVSMPWKSDALLFFAIIHELGHVFGLPHVGPTYTLMSEQYMDFILNKDVAALFEKFDPLVTTIPPGFFLPPATLVHCEENGLSQVILNYLHVPAKTKCLYFSTDEDKKLVYLSVAPQYGEPAKFLGLISELNLNAEQALAVTVVTTEKQNVFSPSEMYSSVLAGPTFSTISGSGTYSAITGQRKPVYLNLRSDRFEILGVVDGQIRSLLKGSGHYWAKPKQNGLIQ